MPSFRVAHYGRPYGSPSGASAVLHFLANVDKRPASGGGSGLRFGGGFSVPDPASGFILWSGMRSVCRTLHHDPPFSTMRATRPATRPALPPFEVRSHPFDMLLSGFQFFDGDRPTDPFIARKRGNILPLGACAGVG